MRTFIAIAAIMVATTPALGSKIWLGYNPADGSLIVDTKTEAISFFQLSDDFLQPAALESDLLDHALFTVNTPDHIMFVSEDLEADDLFSGTTNLGPILPAGLSLAEVEARLTQREFINATIEPYTVETFPVKLVPESGALGLLLVGIMMTIPVLRKY